METIFDPIRLKYVRATPEEKIRQHLLRIMLGELGYPKGLIAVEKEVSSPYETHRRCDIVCYAPGQEGLRPLLLIECKAEEADLAAAKQAFGYNRAIQAPFIAIASKEGVRMFWREGDAIRSVPFLPRFAELNAQ